MKDRKNARDAYYLVFLLLALAVIFYIMNLQPDRYQIKNERDALPSAKGELSPLSTGGYLLLNVTARGTTVFMTASCMQISAGTTPEQAAAIERARLKETPIRPFTHELLSDALQSLDVEVLMVKIEDMRDGIYYSKLFIKGDNKLIALDSRPSDAVAVAYRFSAPVYIKKELMERIGEKVC